MERLRVVLAGLLKKARQGLKDGTMPAH